MIKKELIYLEKKVGRERKQELLLLEYKILERLRQKKINHSFIRLRDILAYELYPNQTISRLYYTFMYNNYNQRLSDARTWIETGKSLNPYYNPEDKVSQAFIRHYKDLQEDNHEV